ncbi:porin family protein [Dysgonomonas sp. ZJ279]|uniref:porin family protein n=1 Tax=Dysgonomonas sp. ZJ279 TaxID=2709796 RepID=UPI0013ED3CFC|nr:porin family protein [Dysgonomonas sp. ZJ279]
MTKKIILALTFSLAVLSIQTASAQIVRYGFRGGIDVINPSFNSDALKVSNRVGYQLGASLDLTVPIIGLGLETGALFGRHNYDSNSLMQNQNNDISSFNYLQVPAFIKQKFSILGLAGLYFTAGAYGNIKLSGGDLTLDGAKYEAKGFQTGLSGGAGVSLLNHLELGFIYRHKLGDTYSSSTTDLSRYNKVDRNIWSITAAYYF